MVLGVRIEVSKVNNSEVTIDESFERCPIAWAVGVPLMVRRETENFKPRQAVVGELFVCVRMMGDADHGLAPMHWQYGGANGAAPPVVAARKDGVPFTWHDWAVLDDFIFNWPYDDPRSDRCRRPTKQEFLEFVSGEESCALYNHQPAHAFVDLWQGLEKRYPSGASVKAKDLTSEAGRALNGVVGIVNGVYQNGRVGINFPEPHGVKALKPLNIGPEKSYSEWSAELCTNIK